MARPIHRLKSIEIDRLAKRRGMHHDGGGLYLSADGKAQCSWLFRYMLDRRARAMGLGPYPTITLAEARDRAAKCRRLVVDGKDPIERRDAEQTRTRLEAAKAITFRQAAKFYMDSQRAGWRNAKHGKLWANTLATYAYPQIGDLPVAAIDTDLIFKVLEPIWTVKPETAGRVRQRIESILDWAKVRGYREGENPARWRGHLEKLLPPQCKVRAVVNHPALHYSKLPAFMAELRQQGGMASRALEFTILTAARTGETIGARWSEIDLKANRWTIPAARMKAAREHIVPLSPPAAEILQAVKSIDAPSPDGFVFQGTRPGRPLSNMALLMLLRRMGHGDVTTHGFRSTFSDWVGDRTNFDQQTREFALAHGINDKTEAAYRRATAVDKRRRMMAAWADYCCASRAAPGGANVISLGSGRG